MNISLVSRDNIQKCDICHKPLSIPPIFYSANLGNICGRCEDRAIFSKQNGESPLERQNIYESIANYLTFPCSYQLFGCTLDLKWDSVSNHEKICDFKKIICPLSHKKFHEQCGWIDDHSELVTHIKRDHKSFFSSPPEVMLTQAFGSKIIFCEITGRLVVIILNHHKKRNRYYCCIAADFNHQECLNYQYQVEISTTYWDNPLILRRSHLEPLYGNTSTRPDNSLEIDISSIEHLFVRSKEIKMKFVIVKKTEESSPNENISSNLSVNRVEELNMELYRDLECPVCVDFMMPPIFICESGHNICSICSTKVAACPMCRGRMRGGRNYTLERLIETINYPCAYREHGCGFIATLPKVKEHQMNCALVPLQCLVGACPYEGTYLKLISHIEKKHSLIELNAITIHDLRKKNCPYFAVFDDRLFVLCFRFDINQPFEYVVHCFGGEGVAYKYQLQIIGSSMIDLAITLGHLCQPLPCTPRRNLQEFTGISLPFAFLSQFLTHFDQLTFKLKIERVNE